MTSAEVVRQLVARTRADFVSYFAGSQHAERAAELVAWAQAGDPRLNNCPAEIDAMLPDTEDDGSWAASYALNAGGIILCLIELSAGNTAAYEEAVTLYFDTVDFRVQQDLEAAGIKYPTEAQIANHPIMVSENTWFGANGGVRDLPDC